MNEKNMKKILKKAYKEEKMGGRRGAKASIYGVSSGTSRGWYHICGDYDHCPRAVDQSHRG